METFKQHAQKARIVLVHAQLTAWRNTATALNCSNAFRCCGLYPFNIQTVLDNKFVTHDHSIPDADNRRQKINGKTMTPEFIRALSEEQYGRAPRQISQSEICSRIGTLDSGSVFARPSSLVVCQGDKFQLVDF